MKLDFTSVGKDVSDHNDLSSEENLTRAIELSDEDLAGVVGAMRRRHDRDRDHRRHDRDRDHRHDRDHDDRDRI